MYAPQIMKDVFFFCYTVFNLLHSPPLPVYNLCTVAQYMASEDIEYEPTGQIDSPKAVGNPRRFQYQPESKKTATRR